MPAKERYRSFRVKGVGGGDDYARDVRSADAALAARQERRGRLGAAGFPASSTAAKVSSASQSAPAKTSASPTSSSLRSRSPGSPRRAKKKATVSSVPGQKNAIPVQRQLGAIPAPSRPRRNPPSVERAAKEGGSQDAAPKRARRRAGSRPEDAREVAAEPRLAAGGLGRNRRAVDRGRGDEKAGARRSRPIGRQTPEHRRRRPRRTLRSRTRFSRTRAGPATAAGQTRRRQPDLERRPALLPVRRLDRPTEPLDDRVTNRKPEAGPLPRRPSSSRTGRTPGRGCPDSIPGPSSSTMSSTTPSPLRARTSIRPLPPSASAALKSRFRSSCRSRSWSPRTRGSPSSSAKASSMSRKRV